MTDTFELKSAKRIPSVGLGTWKATKSGVAHKAVLDALRCGYRHIDCAAVYLNEKEVGKGLKEAFDTGIVKREEVFITSKLWNTEHDPAHVRAALQKTLDDLQLTYLDLYLVHWPMAWKHGDGMFPGMAERAIPFVDIPIIDTWKAMIEVRDAGLTKEIGVSNFSVVLLNELLVSSTVKPAVNQIELHPYLPQFNAVEWFQKKGIHVEAYSPFGSIDFDMRVPYPSPLEDSEIKEIAKKHQKTPADVILCWMNRRRITVLVKSENPVHIERNLAGWRDLILDDSDMEKIRLLATKNVRYLDPVKVFGYPAFE